MHRCGHEQDPDLHENVLTCVNSHQSEADAPDDEEDVVEDDNDGGGAMGVDGVGDGVATVDDLDC